MRPHPQGAYEFEKCRQSDAGRANFAKWSETALFDTPSETVDVAGLQVNALHNALATLCRAAAAQIPVAP